MISTFLYIIEEYVLLGFVDFQDYPSLIQIICNKYEYANTEENEEDCLEIKTACLNLSTTLILIVYGSNKLENLKFFEVNFIIVFSYILFFRKFCITLFLILLNQTLPATK